MVFLLPYGSCILVPADFELELTEGEDHTCYWEDIDLEWFKIVMR